MTATQTRILTVSALVVTPLVFVAALLLALPAGAVNAAVIAAVPTLFTAGFLGGLSRLAVAVERDGRVALLAAASGHDGEPPARQAA